MRLTKGSYCLIAGTIVFSLVFISCQKDLIRLEFPEVNTSEDEVEPIGIGSVRLIAEVIPEGTIPIKVGFVWRKAGSNVFNVVDTAYNEPKDAPFPFKQVITDLILNQTYEYRAFAEFIDPGNIEGSRKDTGLIQTFTLGVSITVPQELPVVNNSTVLMGNVMNLDEDIEVMDHGFVYNSDPTIVPSINDNLSIPISLGIWNGEESLSNTSLENLEFNTTYYYRAWMKSASSVYYYSNTGVINVTDGWKRGIDFPTVFQEGVAFSDGNLAYVIGGCQSFHDCQSNPENNNFVFVFDPVSNSWNDLGIDPISNYSRHNSIGFVLNNEIYFGFGEAVNMAPFPFKQFYKLNIPGRMWEIEPTIYNSPAVNRSRAVSFCIDDKAYFGTGIGIDSLLNDFWEFDPILDTCRRMADLPARFGKESVSQGRRDAIAFSLNQRGYVMGGITVGNLDLSDVWKFTPPVAGNPDDKGKWEFVEFFPGPGRSRGVSFTVGDKAFIALGYNTYNNLQELNDLWEFVPDPEAGASHFQNRVSFPGKKRENAVAFVIGDKAYVGSGQNDTETLGDFWIYTPKKD